MPSRRGVPVLNENCLPRNYVIDFENRASSSVGTFQFGTSHFETHPIVSVTVFGPFFRRQMAAAVHDKIQGLASGDVALVDI